MTVDWIPPQSNGGIEITGYVLEFKVEGTFKFQKASKDLITFTTFNMKNLMEDMKYEYRVAAENRAGLGPFSENTSPIVAKEPLG